MYFKNDKLEKQFYSTQLDNRIRVVIYFLLGFLPKYIHLLITDVIRTQEEQDEIYKDNEQYQEKKWQSPHQYGIAIDICLMLDIARHIHCKPYIYEQIVNIINATFKHSNKERYHTALFHDIGHGWHIHIQVSALNQTRIRKTNRVFLLDVAK